MLGQEDRDAELQAERLRLMLSHTPAVLAGNLAAGLVAALVLLGAEPLYRIGWWFTALLVLLALRLLGWWRFRTVPPHALVRWRPYALLGSLFTGALWGLGAMWLFPLDGTHQLFLAFVLAGIGAGAAVSLAYDPPVLTAFLLASFGPLALRFVQEGTLVHAAMCVLLAIYAAMLVLIARTQCAAITQSIRLQIEKTELAEELRGLLQSLEQKVTERTEALRLSNERLLRESAERHRAERAERAARAEADRANAAKSRFLASAAHDLRQPLQGLRTYFDVLQRELTTGRQQEIAQAIRGTLEANRQLLDALMQLSALESGSVEPRVRRTALPPLLERVAGEYALQAQAKGLRLELHASPEAADLDVESDPVLLENMLRNLIANALAHTVRGRIRLICRVRAQAVRVEVWDTGPGIPPERLRTIFEEFYRIEGAPIGGLGLGLATVARLARLLGHEVRVRSRIGCGSCFALRLARPASARGGHAAGVSAAPPA